MRKIMFDRGTGLEELVLQGLKTVTRRVVPSRFLEDAQQGSARHAGYRVGEVVAVAQRYQDVAEYMVANGRYGDMFEEGTSEFKEVYTGAGWNNKMFVRAELMPHRILITEVGVERLQDISDSDCLREGVRWTDKPFGRKAYGYVGAEWLFGTPRDAYRSIISQTCGKGVWERNPFVFRYAFELVS